MFLFVLGGSGLMLAYQLNPAQIINNWRSGAFNAANDANVVSLGWCESRCRTINDVKTSRVYEGVTNRKNCETLNGNYKFIEQYQLPENMQKMTNGQPVPVCFVK